MIVRKLLFTLFLLAASVAYPQDDFVKVRVNDFSGGQNSMDLPDVLQPNQGVTVKNVVLSRKGRLTKRKGQDLHANDINNTAFTGLGTFYPDTSTSYILAASGPSIVRSDADEASWVTVNPSNWLTSGQNTEFEQANSIVFVLNGTDNTPSYTGTRWVPGSTYPTSPPTGRVAAWLRNYLFISGNPNNPDWVYFSNNLDPYVFSSGDVFKVNTGSGQEILWIEPFKLNELIIYLEGSIYNLDITGSTPLTDWTLQPIINTIGCVAGRTVVNLGNDHWFLSSDPIAVRSLVRSSFDKILIDMVSGPIQDVFNGEGDTTINKTHISKACAVFFDDKYVLAIPTGTSTVNNFVVVFDFITKSWYTITGWYPAAWTVFNNNLYYIDANDGRVLQCFTGTTGDYTAGPVATAASEPSVAIAYEWVGKNEDFGNPENFKMPDALDIEFGSSGSYTATVSIELDDSGWQEVGTVNLAGGAVTLPETLPFTLTASGVARSTLHLQQYGEFKKIKVKVEQSGTDELCDLHRISLFSKMKPWRRE